MTSPEVAQLASTLDVRSELGMRDLDHPTNPGGSWGIAAWAHVPSGLVYAVQLEGATADWYVMTAGGDRVAGAPLYAGTAERMILASGDLPTCATVAEQLVKLVPA